ncbi:hypothetical protein [Nostoc favosum]|uniref:Uncharacterized protein n=1 Tax=Nostoc favosum CHAB5714 TaxID=2780399 RepID=A0ABS8I935_9NOSO|nr:hypothetical protein [Nostoc favosum]MCC5600209.1 hypothetical protein [Nostoc favosum CHAB5714]
MDERSSVGVAHRRHRHLGMLKQKKLNKGLFGIFVVRSLLKQPIPSAIL